MNPFRRAARTPTPVTPDDSVLGIGEGRFRLKHGLPVDLEDSCAGDGWVEPAYCQIHLADWPRASGQDCEAKQAWTALARR